MTKYFRLTAMLGVQAKQKQLKAARFAVLPSVSDISGCLCITSDCNVTEMSLNLNLFPLNVICFHINVSQSFYDNNTY